MPKLEVRTFKTRELRSESASKDGSTANYLVGHAANYNVLSEDLGGWKERIMPGAFARAIRAGQDVRHLINHDPNKILGRTKSGTTVIEEDSSGLAFRTQLPATSYAADLAVSVARGDVDECSFGFYAVKQKWVVENGVDIRELHDLDMVDISTVTYPAYPETQAGLDSRALFPAGAPAELRSHLKAGRAEADPNPQRMKAKIRAMRSKIRQEMDRPAPPAGEFRSTMQEDDTLELLVYADIGESYWDESPMVSVRSVKQQIDANPGHKRIRLRINSPGGDAFEGIAIHNLLRSQGKPVQCIVDGLAASAASIIAMSGDEIEMGASAMMMIHNVSTVACGTAADLRTEADVIDKISQCAAQAYVERSGLPMEEVQAIMDAESWLSAQECLEKGLCTKIVGAVDPEEAGEAVPDDEEVERQRQRIAESRAMTAYRNVPAQYQRRAGRLEHRSAEDEGIEDRRRRARLAIALVR